MRSVQATPSTAGFRVYDVDMKHLICFGHHFSDRVNPYLRRGYEEPDVIIVYGRSCTFDVLSLFLANLKTAHFSAFLGQSNFGHTHQCVHFCTGYLESTQVFTHHDQFYHWYDWFYFWSVLFREQREEQFTADVSPPLAAKRLASFFFPTARNKSAMLRIPSLFLPVRKGVLFNFIFLFVLSLYDCMCICLKLAHFLYNNRSECFSLYPIYILLYLA